MTDTSQAALLVEKVASDPALSSRLKAAETPEAKRTVLSEIGFAHVTDAEIKAYRATAADKAPAAGELTDEQLEAVAGGADMPDGNVIIVVAATVAAMA